MLIVSSLSGEKPPESILDDGAHFSVHLADGATEQQKADLRARLEKQTGITEVRFEDKAAAYESFKKIWADNPEYLETVNPELIPAAVRGAVTDWAAVRRIRDGAAGDEWEALPGIRSVHYPCTTVEECREFMSSPVPTSGALPRHASTE